MSCAADVHLRVGQYGAAKSRLRQTVDPAQQVGDIFFCARSLTRLGTAEQGEGDPRAAIALHHQALLQHRLLSPLTEPSYDWLEMDIHSRLGSAYVATGRIPEARRHFRAVLDVQGAHAHRADRALGDWGLHP